MTHEYALSCHVLPLRVRGESADCPMFLAGRNIDEQGRGYRLLPFPYYARGNTLEQPG